MPVVLGSDLTRAGPGAMKPLGFWVTRLARAWTARAVRFGRPALTESMPYMSSCTVLSYWQRAACFSTGGVRFGRPALSEGAYDGVPPLPVHGQNAVSRLAERSRDREAPLARGPLDAGALGVGALNLSVQERSGLSGRYYGVERVDHPFAETTFAGARPTAAHESC